MLDVRQSSAVKIGYEQAAQKPFLSYIREQHLFRGFIYIFKQKNPPHIHTNLLWCSSYLFAMGYTHIISSPLDTEIHCQRFYVSPHIFYSNSTIPLICFCLFTSSSHSYLVYQYSYSHYILFFSTQIFHVRMPVDFFVSVSQCEMLIYSPSRCIVTPN